MKIAALILGILGSVVIGLLGYHLMDTHRRIETTRARVEVERQAMEDLQGQYGIGGEQAEKLEKSSQKSKSTKGLLTRSYLLMGLGLLGLIVSFLLFKSRAAGAGLMGIGALSFFLSFVAWLGALLLIISGVLVLVTKQPPPVAKA